MFGQLCKMIDTLQGWVQFDWQESCYEAYQEARAAHDTEYEQELNETLTEGAYQRWLASIQSVTFVLRLRPCSEAWPTGYMEMYNFDFEVKRS